MILKWPDVLNLAKGLSGCNADKITQLEKQNKDLHAQLDQQKNIVDLDTQAKCSTAAKTWSQENYGRPDQDPSGLH